MKEDKLYKDVKYNVKVESMWFDGETRFPRCCVNCWFKKHRVGGGDEVVLVVTCYINILLDYGFDGNSHDIKYLYRE